MKHIASCSFGKDSLATILLALEHGEPLDEVLYCEVMFDEHTSGEVPEHRDFIHNTAIPFLKSEGLKVTIIQSPKNFTDLFQKKIASGPNKGKIWAWPLYGRCYVQRDCKIGPMTKYKKSLASKDEIQQYIGIANDETDRIARLDGTALTSLLQKYKIDEAGAKNICIAHGLYSPAYQFTNRGGCFFCPNAKMRELRHLYDHHPDLWAKLLLLQKLPQKVTERFNRTSRFDEIDAQFRAEDAQITLF